MARNNFKNYKDWENIEVNGVKILNCINPEENNIKKREFNAICKCGNFRVLKQYSIVHRKKLQCKQCGWKQIGEKKLKPDSGVRIVWWSYKKGAEKRGLEFSLTKEELKIITSKKCFYCDSEPEAIATNINTKNKAHDYIHNGIDRIDSKLGYNKKNCVPCCRICNYAKRDLELSVFLEHIEKIYKNTRGKI